MEFEGELMQLAALRQSRGISLEEIAEKTRISIYYLTAIEERDFRKLPGGVFRDSFLCQYAETIDREMAMELRARLQRASREAMESQINTNPPSGVVRAAKDVLARGTTALLLCSASSQLFGGGNPAAIVKKHDPRMPLLLKFFEERGCPAAEWAADFLVAADRNGLDWRLLPSIAFLESSGGKHFIRNNPLGWNSAKTGFRSTRHAVHYVADRLAKSPVYAGKSLKTKLRIYNPDRADYGDQVMAVMDQISPSRMAYARGVIAKPAPASPLQAKLTTAR